jgi:hypothetical protein
LHANKDRKVIIKAPLFPFFGLLSRNNNQKPVNDVNNRVMERLLQNIKIFCDMSQRNDV